MRPKDESTKTPEPRWPKLSEEQKDRLLNLLKRTHPQVKKPIPKNVN